MDFSHQKTVLHNVELRLARIRAALSELTDIQTELQKNATESKHDIQANFSRQLESLRTREVYLLNQVDTLLQVKQEHLHLQADSLKKELGALQALQEHARSARKTVDLQDIEGIMKRFQQFQLEPEESGALEFVSDPKHLKQSILSYGSINPKRFCPAKEDVHVKPGQIMTRFEEFTEGKVWLTPKASCGTEDDTQCTVFPIFQEKLDAAGWLSKEQDLPAMETCQSEKSDDDDQDSFIMVPQESEQKSPRAILSHFASIINSPDVQWIRSTSKTDSVGVSRHHQTKPAFYSPSGTKGWLKKDQAQTTCHPSQVPAKPIEIEDLAEMSCVQDTPSGAPGPCGPKTSPRPRTQRNQKNTCCSSKQTPAKTTDVNIDEVCKGNEKCKTFEECLCDDNCADTARGGFKGVPESSKNQWLAKKPAGEENIAVESKDVQQTRPEEELPKEDFVKEWLSSKTTPQQDYESVILAAFLKWQLEEKPAWLKKDSVQQKPDQTSVSQWLFKKAEAQAEPMVVDNKNSSEDAPVKSEWLLPRLSGFATTAFKVPTHDSTSWLLKGKDDSVPQESKMETKEDDLQEKWLIKQTSGGSASPAKPSGFPFFNIPTGINQWLKQ